MPITPRRAQFITVLLGGLLLLAGALMIGLGFPAVKFSVGAPLLIFGALNLLLAPRFSRETLPDDADFAPLANGVPVTGLPEVRRVATIMSEALADTPHEILTSSRAVRVLYDSGVYPTGWMGSRHFRWRTTLVLNPGDRAFTRLDQELEDQSWFLLKRSSSAGGLQTRRHVVVTIGKDGVQTMHNANRADVASAIDKVIEQAGISISMAVMTQVGLLNAALGILAAIGVVVAAMLGLF